MTKKIRIHQKISFRLISILGALALVGAILAAMFSVQLAKNQFFRVMEQQFNSTFSLAENSLNVIGQMAWGWGRHLASDKAFIDEIQLANAQELRPIVERVRRDIHCDTLILLDHQGRGVS